MTAALDAELAVAIDGSSGRDAAADGRMRAVMTKACGLHDWPGDRLESESESDYEESEG